jgi:exodeoxyribonuclease VII large subunit
MKILLLVTVEFHEVYGFALNVLDVDPAYTLGELALARKRVIERLTKEGLIERNRRLTLPVAGYRIAVVSSSAAAGYGDFKHHLETNPWQYRFECTLFPALVQGDSAAESIARAFAAAGVHAGNFDYVVLLRGGGSQIDMACFDDYGVAVAIANCPLPVITGIGHERDESVADMVAALHMKTPTAVADYLVGELREFEDRLVAAWQRLAALSSIALKHAAERLDSVNSALARSAAGALTRNSSQIDQLALRAETAAKSQIERAEARLAQLEQALRLLSPESVLRRGYSIVRRNGRSVRQYSDVSLGDELNIRLYDGMLTAIVEGIEQNGGA